MQSTNNYTAKDIYVLEGLEPVRKRPGMYIGSTGVDGLHHLIWEVVDNSIDEAIAGYAKNIDVVIMPGNKVKVIDDGRGIPVEMHKQTKKSALETVMTTLHAGGKFGGQSYKVSGGLHGVGVSVVNALSKWLKAEVCRDGYIWAQEYERGKPITKVKKTDKCKKTGTTVTFDPDPEVFKEITFDPKRILDHLREQAYLTKGVKIVFRDERSGAYASHTFYFDGGLISFVKFLVHDEKPIHDNIFYISKTVEDILVEAAFQYTEDIQPEELSFANNIHTGEGGMHLTGFRTALTRTLNDYAKKNGYVKESEENLTGDDVREGLSVVLSVKLREPQFEGQTKARLGNPEARTAVESAIGESLGEWLEKNPTDARKILEKTILASKARKAAKAARETVLRKGILEGLALPGKLADCSSKDPSESELFIVEGDSAGGCFSGDSKIALTDGRDVSFKELVEEANQGRQNFCYTIMDNGNIGVAPILNPRKTKKNTEVIKIILDNGKEITCTPDHRFMLRNGNYKEAKYLTNEDSLMPLNRQHSRLGKRIAIEGYEMIFDPKDKRWIFTHRLADDYNIQKGIYSVKDGVYRHHKDFNKLNNNPDNITRLTKEEHLTVHQKMAERTLRRPEVLEKLRVLRQTPEFRNKIRVKILAMRPELSRRAKKQWENEEYKKFMVNKFLCFYHSNTEYREANNQMLAKSQKEYWDKKENREKQAERVRNFFTKYPDRKKWLSKISKTEWANLRLLAWRAKTTKKQWTQEFRNKRKIAYNQTYLSKGLKTLYELYFKDKKINIIDAYNKLRKEKNDKSLIKFETICQRFFDGSEEKLREAIINYNHRIKSILPLKEKTDVYDIEVPKTHNFALDSGIFVHNSAKQGRDRRFQAILPLRGKILNVEKARIDKILAFKEIRALVIALGTAIAEEFNISKLRYHRVVIMTDADVDGAHIRTLLLTLFFRYFPELINQGHIYIAEPPLYKISSGKRAEYAYTDGDKEEILGAFKKDKILNPNIQRYKGLGEMNPEQLWETTMNPENRTMKKVTVEDAEKANKVFDILMGDEVAPRKRFIQMHAKTVKNLDI
ncbi:MAG: DNA topoisomerase (ATP-hydrolyzing) subunit B [Parcubacteria group bacterium]|nr:DNA topoisomerase (ATP-hydrolyzing) subunit B [Parcubacteria group bacterium]